MTNRKNTIESAQRAARAWFRDPELVTAPAKVEHHFPEAMIHIGSLVAIEYASNKFDGKERLYRHLCDIERDLFISPDGKTLVIRPGFKVTTRGLEG